ncbi:MAG: phenylalanine--tRNA ligase subunit beta [Bacteroidales bacterium]|nr:phenylalanine--tRNA ligase subunit beta [Bacteroidales bacterium]
MKISYNWLKEYVHIDLDPEKVSEILTNTGLEVESLEKIETIKGGLKGVVIGHVLTCVKHPDADKLSVTTVDVGNDTILPIVCGAPNVAAGQKVVVATVGTTLYSGDKPFEIKKAKIRGEVSEGMICAEDELGLGESHDGIMVLPEEAEIGMEARAYFNIEEDYIFEIGLTPNRNDAMSHVGVARDLVASLNFQDSNNPHKVFTSCTDSFKVQNNSFPIEVIVEDAEACPRYSGVTISGVTVQESPDWLKNRLLSIGLRPINNLVDISNYILHETGHPTHFFDADKIKGRKIIIRKPAKGTRFITLDEVERELSGSDLMICDANEGMCIAGVFGGLHSGVSESTKNIFIESAYFDPRSIRKTAKYHGLNTDSSFRFERGADPKATLYVMRRAALLVQELAGGEVSSEVMDVYPKPIHPIQIEINYANIDRLIGQKIEHDRIQDILIYLGMEIINQTNEMLVVEVPTFKADVTREADIIEEILRIYGYNNILIPGQVRSSLSYIEKPDREQIQNLVSNYLSNNGFAEIMNNSLTKAMYSEKLSFIDPANDVRIFNPLSNDLGVLRQTLLASGLESVVYNLNRKNLNLSFYEFGKTYAQIASDKSKDVLEQYIETIHLSIFVTGNVNRESWYQKVNAGDFYYLKSIVELILKKLKIDDRMFMSAQISDDVFSTGLSLEWNGKMLVKLGKLSTNILQIFDIHQPVFWADFNWNMVLDILKNHKLSYKPVPKYPEVRRDLALLVNADIEFEQLKKIAFDCEKKLLKAVNLFDVYEGDKIEKGKKSYALSYILQDDTQTLTDKIIDKTMNKIAMTYAHRIGATLR